MTVTQYHQLDPTRSATVERSAKGGSSFYALFLLEYLLCTAGRSCCILIIAASNHLSSKLELLAPVYPAIVQAKSAFNSSGETEKVVSKYASR